MAAQVVASKATNREWVLPAMVMAALAEPSLMSSLVLGYTLSPWLATVLYTS